MTLTCEVRKERRGDCDFLRVDGPKKGLNSDAHSPLNSLCDIQHDSGTQACKQRLKTVGGSRWEDSIKSHFQVFGRITDKIKGNYCICGVESETLARSVRRITA